MANKGTFLANGQQLNSASGDYLTSANGQFRAVIQDDSNFIVYPVISPDQLGVPLWASGANGRTAGGAYAVAMQGDGNLVVYDEIAHPIAAVWATNTGDYSPQAFMAILQDDGRLVVCRGTDPAHPGRKAWQAILPSPVTTPRQEYNPNITDYGGPVLSSVHVQLIFWGSGWANPSLQAISEFTTIVEMILSSSYMASLAQYRGIGQGHLLERKVVVMWSPPREYHQFLSQNQTYYPVSYQDPTPPEITQSPFSLDDVVGLVQTLIDENAVPPPTSDSQILYCVVTSEGITTGPYEGGDHGTLTSYDMATNAPVIAHYAWVRNTGASGYPNPTTMHFTHELVEACTDPERNAFYCPANSNNNQRFAEIGDACSSQRAIIGSAIGDIVVQRYWSERDGCCVP